VPQNAWEGRIERASELAKQYPFAAEMLNFYREIAQFQETLYGRLEKISARESKPGPPELAGLHSSFPSFLAIVQHHGPVSLAECARKLQAGSPHAWKELLDTFWDARAEVDAPADTADEFFARAFLQPYAEFVRARSELKWEGYTGALCPFCGRKPGLGALRQQGDGGRRSLICSFCLAEWNFRRILCPGCGEEDDKRLPVYIADQFAHVRVECCDRCRRFIKTIDLTRFGRAEPLVDELATMPLDLWAHEHGYTKLQKNLLHV
jgi:formate dehydrogenase maturation protein FdhE